MDGIAILPPPSVSRVMSQSDTTTSSRPLLVSLAHAVLKVVGSLFLTVAILSVLIVILFWGMAVEKKYGDTAAKFGIYGSWWFNALGFILGLNSAAGLIRRWPWKVQHLGFVIPHIGLIVLLVGCFLSRVTGWKPRWRCSRGSPAILRIRVPRSTSNSTANSTSAYG